MGHPRLYLLGALALLGCPKERKSDARAAPPDAAPFASAASTVAVIASSSPPLEPSAAPLEPPPPPALLDGGVSVEDGAALAAWMKAREAAAKAGKPELVRVPLVRHGPGWGCICPDHYLGASTSSGSEGMQWITPKFAPTAPELPPDSFVIAEGYFTGKVEPFKSPSVEESEHYTLHELEVLRYRPPTPHDGDMPTPPQDLACSVILAGKDAKKETPVPADGKGYLLVAASVPVSDARAAEHAEKKKAELVAGGFPAAEVLESRRAPGLFCCHLVVVASRHTTDKEARAAALDAKAKGFPMLVRRGW